MGSTETESSRRVRTDDEGDDDDDNTHEDFNSDHMGLLEKNQQIQAQKTYAERLRFVGITRNPACSYILFALVSLVFGFMLGCTIIVVNEKVGCQSIKVGKQQSDNEIFLNQQPNVIIAEKRTKPILFLHFHKAGGTSISSTFADEYDCWEPNKNCNPWEVSGNEKYIMELWNYPKSKLQKFFQRSRQSKVGFVAVEWNYFQPDITRRDLAGVVLVTCVRDPYERFRSNLFHAMRQDMRASRSKFNNWPSRQKVTKRVNYAREPSTFISQNRTWGPGGRLVNGAVVQSEFPINANKPNYYVAMLNGMGQDTGDFSSQVNRKYLEFAKGRLREFDAVIILEEPRTYQLLSKWLTNTTLYHKNAGRLSDIALSRDEFYKDNMLDFELFEFAKNLSLSRVQGLHNLNL